MTFQELQDNEKLKFWYMHITSCSQSSLSIAAYCKENNLNQGTFYSYKKRIRDLLMNQPQSVVLLPDNTVCEGTDDHDETAGAEPVIITKGSIRIEVPGDSSPDAVIPLVRALLC